MSHDNADSSTDRRRRALRAIPPVSRERSGGELAIERAFRGLTTQQAIGYLESLGGHRVDDSTVAGDGWTARLASAREAVGPSYRLLTVTIIWTGNPETVEDVVTEFRLRAFRAPG